MKQRLALIIGKKMLDVYSFFFAFYNLVDCDVFRFLFFPSVSQRLDHFTESMLVKVSIDREEKREFLRKKIYNVIVRCKTETIQKKLNLKIFIK